MIQQLKEKLFHKDGCTMLNKQYPHNGVACIGDQCIQCDDGKWRANKYEEASRRRNLPTQ